MSALRFRLLRRFFLILVLALLAGAAGIYIDWHWKRSLSPRGGRYFFHRVELPVPSFRQGDEKWRDDPLGGLPANGTLGDAGCAVTAAAEAELRQSVRRAARRLGGVTGPGGRP